MGALGRNHVDGCNLARGLQIYDTAKCSAPQAKTTGIFDIFQVYVMENVSAGVGDEHRAIQHLQ